MSSKLLLLLHLCPQTVTPSVPSRMGILASLRIFLLPTKIDPSDVLRLEAAVRIHGGGVVPSAGEADIVCTVLKGRQRIAMTVSTEIMVSTVLRRGTEIWGRMEGGKEAKEGMGGEPPPPT